MAENTTTTTSAAAAKPAVQGTYPAKAYGAQNARSGLAGTQIQRRSPRPEDIQVEILYCGVCHSDLHQVRNEWESVAPTVYPCVPGHESVGRVVAEAGRAVKKFEEGDWRRSDAWSVRAGFALTAAKDSHSSA